MNRPIVSAAVVAELQRQMNHEFAAAHAYTALSLWCADRNLKGFARFFDRQSGEERGHAQKLAGHLLDRGVSPAVREIAAPRTTFAAASEVAEHAREMEVANTRGIHQAYAAALEHKDYAAQVALHWFVKEQVEEEAWCDELVARVAAAASPGGLAQLDHHLEKLLGQGRTAEGGAD